MVHQPPYIQCTHVLNERSEVLCSEFTAASFILQVLKISLLGHRKRIIASLAERPYEEPPIKPPRLSQIRVRTVFNCFFLFFLK